MAELDDMLNIPSEGISSLIDMDTSEEETPDVVPALRRIAEAAGQKMLQEGRTTPSGIPITADIIFQELMTGGPEALQFYQNFLNEPSEFNVKEPRSLPGETLSGLRGQEKLDKMYETGMLNEPADTSMVFDPSQARRDQRMMLEQGQPVQGIPRDIFNSLSEGEKLNILGGGSAPQSVQGIPRDIFDSLPEGEKLNILRRGGG